MFFQATFQPSEDVNYNSEAIKLAGKTIPIQGGDVVDKGQFKGETCFYIPNSLVGFIPASDLKGIEPISFAKWKEIHKSLGFSDR